MGRFKTDEERVSRSHAKRLARLEAIAKAKENRIKYTKYNDSPNDSTLLNAIRQVPGWTGEWENDSKLQGVQDIINQHYTKQKIS